MAKARTGGIIVALALALLASGCTQPSGGGNATGPATSWSINPSVTDPAIANDPLYTHLAYAPGSNDNGKLAVVLHGTSSSPLAYTELAGALRSIGFHVIVLRYSAALGTTGACPDADALTDPDCFRTFRAETTFGAGVLDPTGHAYDHPLAFISQANSVMNRLLKVVDYLQTIAPTSGWGQFQQRTGSTCDSFNATYGACDLVWDKVAAVGHSQGAGVALYLGKFFPLAKVVLLSGSYDAYDLGGGNEIVAPWITEGAFATATADIRTLSHTADFGLGRIRAVEDAVGVTGAEVSVTSAAPPYGGSHRLVTSLASTCPWDSAPGHNSTAVDACAPDLAYNAAWAYLATA